MRRTSIVGSIMAFVVMLFAGAMAVAAAEDVHECDSPDSDRRIRACTELIETPGISLPRLVTAYANRALAHSLGGHFETAIRDYDKAIELFPDFAVGLNNRAWAYFKWGRAQQGMPDVERSLQLDPFSPHTLDTRAHIHQALGNQPSAIRDYETAMVYGETILVPP